MKEGDRILEINIFVDVAARLGHQTFSFNGVHNIIPLPNFIEIFSHILHKFISVATSS